MLSKIHALWTRLTGGGESAGPQPSAAAAVEYKGFLIRPAPYAARQGQFQTAGTIEKEIASEVRRHEFVRAETHPSREDATAFAISKGKQIIDEQGDRIFGAR